MPRNTIEIVKTFIENTGYSLLSDNYVNSKTHLVVKCPKGHRYPVNFSNFKTGKRCGMCQGTKCYNTEIMKKIFQERGFTLIDEYQNPTKKMATICSNGHSFETTWQEIRRGRGCSKCNKIDPKQFLDLLNKKNFKLLSKLKDFKSKTSFPVSCSNGHKFKTSYYLLNSHDSICPKCASKENLIKRTETANISVLDSGYEVLSEYKNNRTHMDLRCPKGHSYSTSFDNFQAGRRCPRCSLTGTSKAELEIFDWVKSLGLEASKYILKSSRLEIDIYIPSLKIGIEYCGLYWHSEANKKDKNYHLNKLKTANEEGIRLITIFEDEWLERKPQIKGFLKSVLGITEKRIYARKCEIKEVEKATSQIFLDRYHIQGKALMEISLGLYFEEELVGLITGNKHHRQGQNSFVLNRLVFKDGVQVLGGASRLLKHLIKYAKDNGFEKLISWSDNRWSEGNVYIATGFVLEEELKPDYSYTKRQLRYSKQSCTKKNLLKKGAKGTMDNTEREMSQSLGYLRIWDCGKKRWVYDL